MVVWEGNGEEQNATSYLVSNAKKRKTLDLYHIIIECNQTNNRFESIWYDFNDDTLSSKARKKKDPCRSSVLGLNLAALLLSLNCTRFFGALVVCLHIFYPITLLISNFLNFFLSSLCFFFFHFWSFFIWKEPNRFDIERSRIAS